MKRKTILIFISVLISIFILSGCVERFTQERVEGNYENKEVYSNGGLAVVYGDYLYFVNGYASQDDKNTFGDVVKGSIARVELDEGRFPKPDTFTIVVPKKFYSTQKDYGGLYIFNDYIYYPTTSMDRDSEGEPKTGEMVLMRTKVDGTNTEIIAEFNSHSIPYKIVNNHLVYVKDNNIYKIDLNDSKYRASVVDEEVESAIKFTKATDIDTQMDNYIFYTKTDEETSQRQLKVAGIDSDVNKTVFSSQMMEIDDVVFTPTILDIKYYSNKLTVFYNIEDDQKNKPYSGIYSYTYDESFDFEKDNFIRYTQNSSSASGFEYKSFYYVQEKVVAIGSDTDGNTKVDLYDVDGELIKNVIVFNASVTFYDFFYEEEEESYFAYYYANSKLKKIKLFELDDDEFVAAEGNAVLYYEGSFATQWIGAEMIEGVLYFFNSNISNNIYFLDLDEVVERDPETRKAKALGKITDKDRIAAF